MTDQKIVQLYWDRSESAIEETDKKYGNYCHSIAYNILSDEEDSKECVNDTYLQAWDSIPPHRPNPLATFLGKITRNLSLNRYQFNRAEKRGSGQLPLVLDELQECVGIPGPEERMIESIVLTDLLNRFLADLPLEHRKIFMQRYWYIRSVEEIARDLRITQSKVKMSLLRSRNKLKELFEKEGVSL